VIRDGWPSRTSETTAISCSPRIRSRSLNVFENVAFPLRQFDSDQPLVRRLVPAGSPDRSSSATSEPTLSDQRAAAVWNAQGYAPR
jgi:hypothetical protein